MNNLIELPIKNFFNAQELVELGFYENLRSLYRATYRHRAPAHIKSGRVLLFPRKCLLEWLEHNLKY